MYYKNLIVVVLLFLFSFVSAQTTDSVNIVHEDIILKIDTTNFSDITDTNGIIIVDTNANAPKVHSPKKAGWMSTGVPGLGQIYNKKAWKLAIIYGGFTGLGIGIGLNHKNYIKFRDEYRNRLNEETDLLRADMVEYTTAEAVNAEKLRYQRNMELFIIFTAVLYLANIIDAIVDAHLMSFDVSDNLSLNIRPSIEFNTQLATVNKPPPTLNFTLTLNF